MVDTLHKYRYLLIAIYSLLALSLTVAIKQDAFLYLNLAIVGAMFTFLLLKNEILLLLVTVMMSIFHEGISVIINGTYIMIYLYGLMICSLLINKRKIELAPSVMVFVAVAFVLSLAPLIITGTSLPILIISTLKRFGFVIVFVFALNIASIYEKSSKSVNRLIIIVLIANFLVAVIQYLQGTYNQDDITGFFGENTTGIFMYLFMFYLAIISGMHYQKRLSTLKYLLLTMIPIIYSAIAEVKIGFVSIAALLLVYLVFINKGIKSMVMLIACSVIFIWSYLFFVSLYPEHDFLNTSFLEDYLVEQSYGGDQTINRFGFKPTIDSVVFEDNDSEVLFGKGLGSGNPSEMDLLMGEVYRDYDYLKYSWFTIPYLYIEAGWVGTLAFLMIYVMPLIITIKEYKREKSALAVVLILMGITNFIFISYNAGLFSYGVTTIFWVYVAMLINHRKLEKTGPEVSPAYITPSSISNKPVLIVHETVK
ncbi:hypothetical protein QMA09_07890 [Planococcus sp. APC 3906]|uniref:hypothetical protein n=1 Tax=Planococcus sp. APC 3906 TaxID=3035194 RepID=UPI0025B3211B|nr:hypothetical protein [Planococcus sp. APC 3906]MDN3450108.1 hypothetical protein [Planococcus sp. APC 3906]